MADETAVTDHYVARIVVERVSRVEETEGTGSYRKIIAVKRDVTELGNFMVKSAEIEDLKGKVANHVGLIEDYEQP